jgi:crossover junction endodeoxyribonuclease RusA
MAICFTVPGTPRPGGSKSGFINRKTGKPIIAPASELTRAWRATVRLAASEAYDGPLLTGPVRLDVLFMMPRPKKHFRTGKQAGVLRDDAPYYHTSKPDRTKLLRATEDALKGVLWGDDSQVCLGDTTKAYGEKPGAYITVSEADKESEDGHVSRGV